MKLFFWVMLFRILLATAGSSQDPVRSAFFPLSGAGSLRGRQDSCDIREIVNNRDGDLIVGSTTVSNVDFPSSDPMNDTATRLDYGLCDPIPERSTITCELSECNIPSGTSSGIILSIIALNSKSTCDTVEGVIEIAEGCPASVSFTFPYDAYGMFRSLQINSNNETITGVTLRCSSSNYNPTTTTCGDPKFPSPDPTPSPTPSPTPVPTPAPTTCWDSSFCSYAWRKMKSFWS